VISSSLNDFVFFIFRLCAVCFLFSVLVWCLFDSGWNVSFKQVQIRSMTITLASSTLQIQRHEYSRDFNIVILVIFVDIGTLTFYAINMDVVSLFTDSSFLFLANLNLHCIDVLYQFEWINVVYFCQKKNYWHKVDYFYVYMILRDLFQKWKYLFSSCSLSNKSALIFSL